MPIQMLQHVQLADGWLVHVGPPLAGAGAIFVAFFVGARIVSGMIASLSRRRSVDPDLVRLMGRVARLVLLAFGTVSAIGTLGIDVKALIAGLGLTGFALGFALKDVISNTLAGVLILLYKPFRRGDRIDVGGNQGLVEAIDLRYTTLASDDRSRVLVPNANLFTNNIRVRPSAAAAGDPSLGLRSSSTG